MATQTAETETTAVASEDAEAPRVGLGARLLRRESVLVAAGIAAAGLLWLGLGALTGADPDVTEEPAATELPPLPPPQPELSAKEYLDLGRAALGAQRIPDAERLIGEGLLVAEPRQRRLRADLCRTMADVCTRLGKGEAAALYRSEAAELLSGLEDAVLAVFAVAEEDLRAGRSRDARRRLHRIALGGGQPGAADAALVRECERRLATTFESEYRAGRSGRPLDRLPEPVLFDTGGGR